MSKARWRRLRPAGSPEAAFSARACLRLPRPISSPRPTSRFVRAGRPRRPCSRQSTARARGGRVGSTAKAAGWPRLAGAQGSHRHELALIEASGAPAGRRPCQPLAVHHVRAAGATPRAASAGLGGGRRGSWPGRTPTPRAARRRRPLSSTTRWLPWPGGCVAGDWASGSRRANLALCWRGTWRSLTARQHLTQDVPSLYCRRSIRCVSVLTRQRGANTAHTRFGRPAH